MLTCSVTFCEFSGYNLHCSRRAANPFTKWAVNNVKACYLQIMHCNLELMPIYCPENIDTLLVKGPVIVLDLE